MIIFEPESYAITTRPRVTTPAEKNKQQKIIVRTQHIVSVANILKILITLSQDVQYSHPMSTKNRHDRVAQYLN